MSYQDEEELGDMVLNARIEWEEAQVEAMCMSVVIACGPPPPKPHANQAFGYGREGLETRTKWLDEVTEFAAKRWHINSFSIGPIITAIDLWWMEIEEDTMH